MVEVSPPVISKPNPPRKKFPAVASNVMLLKSIGFEIFWFSGVPLVPKLMTPAKVRSVATLSAGAPPVQLPGVLQFRLPPPPFHMKGAACAELPEDRSTDAGSAIIHRLPTPCVEKGLGVVWRRELFLGFISMVTEGVSVGENIKGIAEIVHPTGGGVLARGKRLRLVAKTSLGGWEVLCRSKGVGCGARRTERDMSHRNSAEAWKPWRDGWGR